MARQLIDFTEIERLRSLVGAQAPVLLPVSALEDAGFNAIPDAMAEVLAEVLNWQRSAGVIVQSNRVGHTRARAFNRLVTPAAFEGRVFKSVEYVLVDDHIGLGGTLANLRGYIESRGGRVLAMTTLTESRGARVIALQTDTRNVLYERHGQALEELWKNQFGHGIDCLTNIEGSVLGREPTVDAIRDRIAQASVEVRERGLDVGPGQDG